MSKGTLITGYFVVLFFLHQDSWWRNDPRLVLGFLPVSLGARVLRADTAPLALLACVAALETP